ncbi:hypothetical protein [Sulfurimonas sp.]
MDFIYNNKKTGTFAEFSVENIKSDLSVPDAIDALMEIIKNFNDKDGIFLPSALLKLLSDGEIDFFMLAAYNERICEDIEQMLYVVQDNVVVTDEFKTQYRVEYIGKKKSVISFDSLDNLEIFNIPNSTIKDGIISLKECKEEVFGV